MNYKFELTVEEVNIILASLSELPFKVASPVIDKIVKQANAQKPNPEQPKPQTDPVKKK